MQKLNKKFKTINDIIKNNLYVCCPIDLSYWIKNQLAKSTNFYLLSY